MADGSRVTTIEGLAPGGALHPIQSAFHEHHALQCGFCMPGMIMAVRQLLTPKSYRPRAKSATTWPATSAAVPATATSYAQLNPLPRRRIAMTDATAIKYVGQPLRRREDFKFVTGKGRYTDDIKARACCTWQSCDRLMRMPSSSKSISLRQMQRQASVCFVRCRTRRQDRLDCSQLDHTGTKVPNRPVVAIDRVRFVGECVALAIAETQAMAHDAIGWSMSTTKHLPP